MIQDYINPHGNFITMENAVHVHEHDNEKLTITMMLYDHGIQHKNQAEVEFLFLF